MNECLYADELLREGLEEGGDVVGDCSGQVTISGCLPDEEGDESPVWACEGHQELARKNLD